MAERIFVFVVCGAREHIDTLHFSLRALRKFTQRPIWVVTDSRRNEIPVDWEKIIEGNPPEHYTHHQAGIWMKTGLHRILPSGNQYCYLDSDVVALSESVNEIFSHYLPPVSFSTDHCRLNAFSPYAVKCDCRNRYHADQKKLDDSLAEYITLTPEKREWIKQQQTLLGKLVKKSKENPIVYLGHIFRYYFSRTYYKLNDQYWLHKKSKMWFTSDGQQITFDEEKMIRSIETKTSFRYNFSTGNWSRQDGSLLSDMTCTHLHDQIRQTFQVEVKEKNWQHWNGGVFLFDDQSYDFMESWFQAGQKIFTLADWETRDQGTLAMNVWKFNLQQHPVIPIAYNFLADYGNEQLQYKGNLTFAVGEKKQLIRPYFIHIYHQWGNINWAVWQDVERHVFTADERDIIQQAKYSSS